MGAEDLLLEQIEAQDHLAHHQPAQTCNPDRRARSSGVHMARSPLPLHIPCHLLFLSSGRLVLSIRSSCRDHSCLTSDGPAIHTGMAILRFREHSRIVDG